MLFHFSSFRSANLPHKSPLLWTSVWYSDNLPIYILIPNIYSDNLLLNISYPLQVLFQTPAQTMLEHLPKPHKLKLVVRRYRLYQLLFIRCASISWFEVVTQSVSQWFTFLDALASLDFKLSVSQWVSQCFTVFFTASASTGLSDLFLIDLPILWSFDFLNS